MCVIDITCFRRAFARVVASLFLLQACAPPPLPPPELPLTPTPDAPFRARMPGLGSLDALRSPKIDERLLDNGLRIMVVERPDLPLVSIAFASRAARDERVRVGRGLAALTLKTILGSVRSPTSDGDESDPESGDLSGGRTGSFGTTLTLLTHAADADPALKRLALAIRSPSFALGTVERARGWLRGALATKSTKVLSRLRKANATSLYGEDHPATWSLHEDYAQMAAFTPQEVEQFHRLHYGPSGSALIVAGAITAERAFTLAHEAFADWQSPPAAPASKPPPARRSPASTRAFQADADPASLSLAVPCAAIGSPDELPFELIATLMDRMSASRFASELRHDSALSYAWDVACRQRADSATFFVETSADVRDVGKVLALILAQLERVARGEIRAEELEAARRVYLAERANALGENSRLAESLAEAHLAGRPRDFHASLPAQVRAVTVERIQAVARQYFTGVTPAIAARGRGVQLARQLENFGPVLWEYF